jgi:hypothetical protein
VVVMNRRKFFRRPGANRHDPGIDRQHAGVRRELALVRAGARSVLPDQSIVKIGVKGVAFLSRPIGYLNAHER